MNLDNLSEADLRRLYKDLDDLAVAKESNRLDEYTPYLKQLEFHANGRTHSERLLKAGNQLGKTYCGAAEAAIHLTGRYPAWWVGRRWDRPVRMWIGGESMQSVRGTTQKLLLGDLAADRSNLGTGLVPKECLPDQPNWSRGTDSAVDNIRVKHKSGKFSTLLFKSYEQGRVKWQGDTIDIVWFDEEPPPDVYSEGLARLTATDGISYMTFTPLKGMSTVVKRFLQDGGPQRIVTNMTMAEAPHMTPEMIEKTLERYPEHERATRMNGDVMKGEGRIFSCAESLILCEPFEIPGYWKHIVGLDLGHGQSEQAHPTAAVWIAIDPDQDVMYVYGTYRTKGGNIPMHASAIRARGRIPVAWPHDAHAGDRASGKPIAAHYKEQGCFMLSSHAVFTDGSISVWAGITEMQNRMESNRFKVFSTCLNWMEEYRNYHMEDGKIVALDDDLLSATRYALMMKRYARTIDTSWRMGVQRKPQTVADGVDFNPLA